MKHSPTPLLVAAAAALMFGGSAPLAQTTREAPAPGAPQPTAAAEDTARAAVGAPVQAAQALLRENKAAEALAKLKEAEAVGGLTPYETMIIERTRAVAAQASGDVPLTAKSIEAAISTGKVAPPDQLPLIETLIGNAGRQRDHERVLRWTPRYYELGGTNDSFRMLRINSQIATGDDKGALAGLSARVEGEEKAGRAVPEPMLRTLMALQRKADDAAAAALTLEKLAVRYPRPEYWQDMVAFAARRAGNGNERALAGLYRLLRTTSGLGTTGATEQFAYLALRTGQPVEAQVVIDEGYAAGLLGSGAGAAEHTKMRDDARKQAAADIADRAAAETAAQRAADGNALVTLGWSIVTGQPRSGAAAEQVAKGLALIEQGVAKGGLRRPVEARLQLGIAQLAAGRKEAGQQTLSALAAQAGNDPLAEPIKLWALWSTAAAPLPAYRAGG